MLVTWGRDLATCSCGVRALSCKRHRSQSSTVGDLLLRELVGTLAMMSCLGIGASAGEMRDITAAWGVYTSTANTINQYLGANSTDASWGPSKFKSIYILLDERCSSCHQQLRLN